MEKEDAFRLVREYLVTDFEVPEREVHPGANLFTDLGLDSIDALDWFAKMESTLCLPIVEEELKRVRTVQDVVEYVLRNQRSDGARS